MYDINLISGKTCLQSFIENNLRFPSGEKIECALADTCIGGVAESAMCASKFKKVGLGVSLTVTPCWCYGVKVMDTDTLLPKAVWGFNGTERTGAVYLAAALAGHKQKGLPTFGIYGRDVQDAGDTSKSSDVKQKILRFIKTGLTLAQMNGKSYLSIGYSSMGIVGSMVDSNFFQDYLGIRTEFVDSIEILRRIDEVIYYRDEYQKALAWTKENCKEGVDLNPPENQADDSRKQVKWETVVKMTLTCRDMMIGNQKLIDRGFREEGLAKMLFVVVFKISYNGLIRSLMPILLKLFFIHLSTGMEFVRHSFLQQRTTVKMQCQCC